MTFSDWAAPVVPLVKMTAICRDYIYKITVNQGAQADILHSMYWRDIRFSRSGEVLHKFAPITCLPAASFWSRRSVPLALKVEIGCRRNYWTCDIFRLGCSYASARCRLQLKCSKYSFMLPEVEWLGHCTSADGLKPPESKVQAISEAPTPKSTTDHFWDFLIIIASFAQPIIYIGTT